MHFVTLVEEKLGQVGPILPCNSSDQCFFQILALAFRVEVKHVGGVENRLFESRDFYSSEVA